MATKRASWEIRPGTIKASDIPKSLKTEVEEKARKLILTELLPKLEPPKADLPFNYVSDYSCKWYRQFFYFTATFTCPSPNAISPSFEEKFARMEFVGNGKFAMYFMRHTGEWVGLYDQLSVTECMDAIRDDDWFQLG